MNITVYLGASETEDVRLREAARELGEWIAANGHTLIYGGSKCGLMGELACAVVEGGAKAIGVEPRMFVEKELQYDDLTELIVTENMAERKEKMIELGEAFIAFPGGTGTLEEISEVMSRVSLGHLDAPCMFYDIDGYYEGLRAQIEKMKEKGLSSDERLAGVYFVSDIGMIADIIEKTDIVYNNKLE